MIDGVTIKPLKKIPDERGVILHMLKNTDKEFKKFGEIYFSLVYPGVVKGWHYHKKMTLNYAVIKGMIKLVLFDDRDNSPTKGELMEIFLGDNNYSLVTIPPKIWNGFKGIGTDTSYIANCSDIPHNPDEIQRMSPNNNSVINYKWGVEFK